MLRTSKHSELLSAELTPGEPKTFFDDSDQLKVKADDLRVGTDLLLCERCGVNEVYENNLCWDCLDG